MLYGGYSGKTTQIVARRVIAKYTNNMYNYREEGRPLYRSKNQRALVQKPDKATWFRKTGATATLTVPHTPNSELSRMLRMKIMGTGPKGTSVLVLERPGATIMSGIAKNNPFPRNTCGRATCPFGPQDCREKCYKENITYQAVCERCRIQPEEERERNPRLPTYIGETSRTLFTRYQQHVAD